MVSYTYTHSHFILTVVVRQDHVITLCFELLVLRDEDLFFKEDLATVYIDNLSQDRFGLILNFKHDGLVNHRVFF